MTTVKKEAWVDPDEAPAWTKETFQRATLSKGVQRPLNRRGDPTYALIGFCAAACIACLVIFTP